jgi:hypothetical protein
MARSNPARRDVDERVDDDVADVMDVPAAVVCAVCGRGDCSGCADEQTGTSGVVAIVPWERPAVPVFARFFATVHATTQGAEAFFFALPDGSVSPALSFAVIAEGCAVVSMALLAAPFAAAAFPKLALNVATNAATRHIVLGASAVGILGLTALLVGAHALHGISLGKNPRRRALRVGLYACGWDVGASPAGALMAAFSGGVRAALSLVNASISAPRRGVAAALEGIFQVRGAVAARVRNRAVLVAMAASVAALAVLLFLIVATPLLAV